MPKLSKQFYLEITVEQFLNSCSYLELQELDLLLEGYLRKARHTDLINEYKKKNKSLEAKEKQ
ncbi:hypothetical protein [Algoriphagus marincola]|uniref:hypothetical protein n=1 Tax=Algoriphagus marincola TaxID=264027 RepID=UPI00047A1365|nr:hypothetical protein [Algoriphagus marincola]